MIKYLSPSVSKTAFNIGTLVLRIVMGAVMIPDHGWKKIANYADLKTRFMDFMGLGSTISLNLAIFAEFFCAILIILGLFTRFATIPLIITMVVAAFIAMGGDIFVSAQLPTLFLAGYITILFLGPGGYSLDALIFKNKDK